MRRRRAEPRFLPTMEAHDRYYYGNVQHDHEVESASGAVSDTAVSSPLADRTTDRIVAERDHRA